MVGAQGPALRHTLTGIEVVLATQPIDDGVRLVVSDTGIGMFSEEMRRLFSEFSRIRNARTRGILGTGLGLSIVRRIAELDGGSVAVESLPDAGTTFTVTLRDISEARGA